MSSQQLSVSVSNIGGIDETEQTFSPGVTVLAGRNATNRTSFLQAVMAAFGSTRASLKADADEGAVELVLDGETYTRTLTRTNGRVTYGGDPFLEDAEVADLFAFLIETNEARLAVPRGDDLRDIIMRPVDTAAIQAEIQRLESEKREIDEKIEELESQKDRLPKLEERLTERKEALEETREKLAEKESELDELDRGLEETRQEKREVEETFSELRNARQDFENLQYKLETQRESLESLVGEREELEEAREELDTASEARLEELTEELDRHRTEKQALESEIGTLQRVIKFNEGMLEGTSADIATALRADGGSADSKALSDQLLEERETVCWTCGSTVQQSSIKETLDRLRSLSRDKHGDLQELEHEIDDVKSEKQSIEAQQERAEEALRRRQEVEDEIERRKDAIEDIEERVDEQSTEIERLEAKAGSVVDDEYSEILETHKEANQLEFELDRLQTEVADIEDEIESVEDRIKDVEDLERDRERVASELQEQRTKIERLEEESVEAFNEHMDEILDILEYENLERIWLERTEQQVRSGRRTVSRSFFDLHIIRSTADGATYEDTVDHLSESEREVTGLIFALAGYLTHEVYETLPVMLLDSLEAIDADRIAALVEYFEQYSDYLLVALLPDDASALEGTKRSITDL